MDYFYWTKALFLLTVPAFLLVSCVILRKMQRESGKFPIYWACFFMAGLIVFMEAAFAESHRIANGIYIDLMLFVFYWAAAIKIGLGWWKARRAKSAHPD